MSNDIDGLPIYDKITDGNDNLSPIWLNWFSTFIDTLTDYLTQGGLFPPQLTSSQQAELQNLIAGQTIFNTTTSKGQMWDGTQWQDLF